MDIKKLVQKVIKYFNRASVYGQLRSSMKFLLPHKKNIVFKLNIGGGSFTDGQIIVIGLPEYMIDKEDREIFSALKAITGHESEHVNSSDFEYTRIYLKEASDYLYQAYGINRNLGVKISDYIENAIEDGRIEKRLVNRMKGYLKHIKYFRGMWWKYQPVSGEDEYNDFVFAICTVATTGLYPKDWDEFYKGSRAEQNIEKIKPLIMKAINASTEKGCCNYCMDILKEVGEYIAELIQDQNMLNNLMQMIVERDYNTSEAGQSTAPSGSTVSVHFKPEKKDDDQDQDQDQNQQQGQGGQSSEEQEGQDQQQGGQSGSQSKPSDKEDENNEQGSESSNSSSSKEEDDKNKDGKSSGASKEEDKDEKSTSNNEENEQNQGGSSGKENEEENEKSSGTGSDDQDKKSDDEKSDDKNNQGSGSDEKDKEDDKKYSGAGSDKNETENENEKEEENSNGSGSKGDENQEENDQENSNSNSGKGENEEKSDKEEEKDNSGSGSGEDKNSKDEENKSNGNSDDQDNNEKEEENQNGQGGTGSDDEEKSEEDKNNANGDKKSDKTDEVDEENQDGSNSKSGSDNQEKDEENNKPEEENEEGNSDDETKNPNEENDEDGKDGQGGDDEEDDNIKIEHVPDEEDGSQNKDEKDGSKSEENEGSNEKQTGSDKNQDNEEKGDSQQNANSENQNSQDSSEKNEQDNDQYGEKEDNFSDYTSDSDIVEQELDKVREEALTEAQRALDNAKKEDDMEAKKKQKEEDEAKASSVSPDELDEIAKKYKNDEVPMFRSVKFDKQDVKILPTEIEREAKKLEKEVKAVLINKKPFNSKHQRRGVLDTNSLWQFGVKDYNMFQKKGNPNKSNYVFYILEDGSGSMSERVDDYSTKWFYASKASAIIEEAIKPYVPFKVATYTAGYVDNLHYVVKDFNENNKANKCWNFYHYYKPNNGNKDGHSIRVATKELQKRTETNKVLIILSDGLPSAYNSNTFGQADVRDAVREARKNGVTVISIAFGSEAHRKSEIDTYKAMYQNGIISCDPSMITNELIKVFKKELSK